jgi:prephenate dehydratase
VLTFRGDMKKSYDSNQEAIEYASTSRMLNLSSEVLVAAQQLSQSGLDIPTKKANQTRYMLLGKLLSKQSNCKKMTRPRQP